MSNKAIEITYDDIPPKIRPTRDGEEIYSIAVTLRSNQVATIQVITTVRQPFPLISVQCDDKSARVWIQEIKGQVIRIGAKISKKNLDAQATIRILVMDGMCAKRM